ncbi:MAG TPA: sigma-70 family RNA polymerase sigma factor [Mycobacteriales bacterium]|nr:sigma-70 family RNA polymerase sigma factor [Mycobacteriales bacterium]
MDSDARWVEADRHRVALVRYLRKRTELREDAEDAAAEAIARAGRTPLDDEAHLQAWLYRTGRHRCIDQHRRRRTPAELAAALAPTTTASAEEIVLEHELTAQVRHAVAELPPGQRAVVLAYGDGETVRTIAARTGRTAKAVERQLARGLAAVRATVTAGAAAVLAALPRCRRLAAADPAIAALPASMVVVVVAGVLAPAPPHARPAVSAATVTMSAPGHPRPATPTSRVAGTSRRAEPHRIATASRVPEAPPPTASRPPAIAVPAPGHDITVTPGTVNRDEGDGFVADAIACIRHGVDLTPQRISCRPD